MGYHFVVQALIQAGAQVNEPDGCGMTPLVAACHTGQARLVQLLLSASADPNLAEADGQTPLIAAAEDGFANIVEILLGAGADVDTTDAEYQTPLMAAAAEGCIDSVSMLLAAGADANHCDEEGTTVLMVSEFDEELIDMHVEAGADVNATDGDDETVLFKAARVADAEFVEWLLTHDADPHQITKLRLTAFDAAQLAVLEGLCDAQDVIDMLRAHALSEMDTDSQYDSSNSSHEEEVDVMAD